ncbi:hypothetical protein FRC10_005192 [Ceratobasidium sp. 414]|nr:hypothetical protein FRC10_005192 [Ceratobasidium sp. 414]
MSRSVAAQLYSSPLPFGQITVDPAHATNRQEYEVFYRVIISGCRLRVTYRLQSIFYEFPSDLANPLPPPAPFGSARGLLFFSTPNVPSRILFKVFISHPCPPALCRGGQPGSPGLVFKAKANSNVNGAVGTNGANGGGAVLGTGAAPALVPTGVPPGIGAGAGFPGAGPRGQPNPGANNMFGAQAPCVAPGGFVAGAAHIASMMPGARAGARSNPIPMPPNAYANPAMGANLGMAQGLDPGGIPGPDSFAMPTLGVAGAPGFIPNNVPGLAQPGAPAGLLMNERAPVNTADRMALARIGLAPAQFASATQQQKAVVMQRVWLVMQLDQQRQQEAANGMANGMANGVASGMAMGRPPGMIGPGQPGFEQLQAFMRQQQQRQ